MSTPRSPAFESPGSPGVLRLAGVPAALLLLAGALWTDPLPFHSPVGAAAAVPGWATDPRPVRKPKLTPVMKVAGYDLKCSSCHKLFPSPPETTRSLYQHTDITMKHGINERCFNCHHLTNRDAYTDDWGHEIPADEPHRLCGKCHGPVYRDWLHGSHGRTNGHWDTARGEQSRRTCIECHDPHRPPFPPMPPAPGPHTLRMGPQDHAREPETLKNPLQLAREQAPEQLELAGPPYEPEAEEGGAPTP